jgi:hypothetical protein
MLPGKVDRSIDALDSNPGVGFLFTNFETMNSSGQLLNSSFLEDYNSLYALAHWKIDQQTRIIEGKDLLDGLAKANFIGTSSVAIRRSALRRVGAFEEQLKNGDDYNLWVRLSLQFSALFLDLPFHQYRIHQHSISKSNPSKRLENLVKLHKKHCTSEYPKSFIKSSQRKVGQYSLMLSKIALKDGNTHQACQFAKEAIRYNYKPTSSLTILLISALPRKAVKAIIQLRKQVAERT